MQPTPRCLRLLLPLLALVYHSAHAFTFATAIVNLDSYTINTTATYTVELPRKQDDLFNPTAYSITPVLTNATATIVFPAQYTNAMLANFACLDVQVNFNSVFGYTCALAGLTITITNALSSTTIIEDVIVTLGGIVNPASALTTDPIIGTIASDVSNNGANAVLTFTKTFLSGLSISFPGGTVNRTSDMVCTLITTNAIPPNGIITVLFPVTLVWARDLSNNHLIPINKTLACYGLTTSINNATINCQGLYSTQTVTITNAFTDSVPAGSTVSFALSGLFAPPTTEPVDSLSVTTNDKDLNAIDWQSSTLSGFSPQSLSLSLQPTTTFTVNSFAAGLICSFSLTDTISFRDTFSIYLPSGSTVSYSQSTSTFKLQSGSYNAANFTVNMVQTASNPNYAAGTAGSVTFIRLRAPPSTKPTNSIQLAILNNGFPKMIGSATISAVANSYPLSVGATSSTVGVYTSYTFSFTMVDALTSSGLIVITLDPNLSFTPNQINTITSNLSVTVSGSSIRTSPAKQITTTTIGTVIYYTLTLSNLNTSNANIPAQSVTVTVSNLLNCPAVCNLTTFSLSTYYTSSTIDLVANANYTGTIALQPGNINLLTAASSALTTYTFTTLTLTFSNQNTIPLNGHLAVTLPSDLTLLNICTTTLSLAGSPVTITTVNIVASNAISITLTDTAISSNSQITVAVSNIMTQNSTKTTNTFTVKSYDAVSNIIDVSTNSLGLAISNGNPFNAISLTRNSSVNSEATNYTITFEQIQNFTNVTRIGIFLSNWLLATSLSRVYEVVYVPASNSFTTTPLLITTPNSSTILATLSQSQTNNHTIILSTIINPPSLQTVANPILVQTYTADSLYTYSSMYTEDIVNTAPSPATISSYSFSNYALSESNSLAIVWVGLSAWPSLIYSATLNIPNTFSVANASCQSPVTKIYCSFFIPTNTLTVSMSDSSNLPLTVNLTILALINPNDTAPQTFTLTTVDANNNQVQTDNTTIIFSNNCTLPCRTCLSNATTCLTCYNSTISPYTLLYNTQCLSQCPNSTFQTNTTCTPCDPSCLSCSTLPTNCTACNTSNNSSQFLQSTNASGSCLAACPTGNYNLTFTCFPCNSSCASCDSLSCFTCTPATYLYNGTCLPACPNSTFSLNSTCYNCSATCLTCLNSSTHCLSCPAYTILYNNTCLSTCPLTNMYVTANQTCDNCSNTCMTCSILNTNCTSCFPASNYSHYLNGSCLALCPELYYPNTTSGVCLSCKTLNISCDNCSSNTTCLSCDTGYLYFSVNQSCLTSAPTGYVQINNTLQTCNSSCLSCAVTVDNCTACSGNLSLYQNGCLSTCPINLTVSVSNLCAFCTYPCATCINSTSTCLSCTPNSSLFYDSNTRTCVNSTACTNGTYANNLSFICTVCNASCLVCTDSAVNCTLCSIGYYLTSATFTCADSCINGSVPANVSGMGVCTTCTLPCSTCAVTVTNCTSCSQTNTSLFLATNGSCVSSILCPNYTYPNTTTFSCSVCPPPCLTCSTANTCLSCLSNYSLISTNNTCSTTCPPGELPQAINNSSFCTTCAYPCLTCANNLTTCTSCNQTTSPLFLTNSSCVNNSQCPAGKYPNSTTYTCETCPNTCQTCDSLATCNSCVSNYYLAVNTSSCLTTCPNMTVPGYNSSSARNECLLCQPPCLTCNLTITTCTACQPINNQTYFLSNTTCVTSTTCPNGTYPNNQTFQCSTCNTPCLTCLSPITCTDCSTDYYLFNAQCLQFCPNGSYVVNATGIMICLNCTGSCLTCTATATKCTACPNNTYLLNNTCVNSSTCPNGTFPNAAANTCAGCSTPCATCTNNSNCSSCISGQYLIPVSSSCVSLCPNGTLASTNTSINQCLNCNSNCSTCTGNISSCSSCPNNTYLFNQNCVPSSACPNSTFPNSTNNLCQICNTPCVLCLNSTTCLTCFPNYYLSDTNCLSNCPNGTVATNSSSGGLCAPCTTPCTTCVNTVTQCLNCLQNLTALYLLNNTCVSNTSCLNGTYPNSTTFKCESCAPSCLTCGSTSTQCLSCSSGNYLLSSNNTCGSSCPSGQVGLSSTSTCANCTPPCLTCQTSQTSCSACQPGSYLVSSNNSCPLTCPANLLPGNSTWTCLPCTSPCSTCLGIVTNCTTCLSNYILFPLNSSCLSKCPDQYYSDGTTCTICSTLCNTCSNFSSCLSCSPPLLLTANQCATTCPPATPFNQTNICLSCSQAQNYCYNCNLSLPTAQCLLCWNGKLLHEGSCLSACPSGYQATPNATCTPTQSNSTNNILTSSLTTASAFPLPFTITGSIIFVACFMSKLQNGNTYVVGTAYALYGFIQTGCLLYLIYSYNLYLQSSSPAFNGLPYFLLSLLLILALNLLALLVQTYQLSQDQKFKKWLKSHSNFSFYVLIVLCSASISYKFKMMLFTRLFGFQCLRGQLQNIQKFRFFNVLSFFGMGHEGLVLYISGLVIVTLPTTERFFLTLLDLIIVNVLNIILALAVSAKDQNFFEEEDGGFKINKVMNDFDQYKLPAMGELDSKGKGLESRDNLQEADGEGDNGDEELTFSVSDRNDDEQSSQQSKVKFKTEMLRKNQSAFAQVDLHQQSGVSLTGKDDEAFKEGGNRSAIYPGEFSRFKAKKTVVAEGLFPKKPEPPIDQSAQNIFANMNAGEEEVQAAVPSQILLDSDNSIQELKPPNQIEKGEKHGYEQFQEETPEQPNAKAESAVGQVTNVLFSETPRDNNTPPPNISPDQLETDPKLNSARQIKVYKGKPPLQPGQPEQIEQINLTIIKKQQQLIALRKSINRKERERERSQERHSNKQHSQREKRDRNFTSERGGTPLLSNYNAAKKDQTEDQLEFIQLATKKQGKEEGNEQIVNEQIVPENQHSPIANSFFKEAKTEAVHLDAPQNQTNNPNIQTIKEQIANTNAKDEPRADLLKSAIQQHTDDVNMVFVYQNAEVQDIDEVAQESARHEESPQHQTIKTDIALQQKQLYANLDIEYHSPTHSNQNEPHNRQTPPPSHAPQTNIFEYQHEGQTLEQQQSSEQFEQQMNRYNQSKQPRQRLPRRIEKDKPSPSRTHLEVALQPDDASNSLSLKISTLQKNNLFNNNPPNDSEGAVGDIQDQTERNPVPGNRSHLKKHTPNKQQHRQKTNGRSQYNDKDSNQQFTERFNKPPMQNRPTTAQQARTFVSGFNQFQRFPPTNPKDLRHPTSLSIDETDDLNFRNSRQLHPSPHEDHMELYPSSNSSNQIRRLQEQDQVGNDLPRKPRVTAVPRPRNTVDSSQNSIARKSMKSYRSRSVLREQLEQSQQQNSREHSNDRKSETGEDLSAYYKRKQSPSRSKSRSRSREAPLSLQKRRSLQKIYLQKMDFRPK